MMDFLDSFLLAAFTVLLAGGVFAATVEARRYWTERRRLKRYN
jgi:hypothetical protein